MTAFVKLLIIAVLLFFFICICAFVSSRTKSENMQEIFYTLAMVCIVILIFTFLGLLCCV